MTNRLRIATVGIAATALAAALLTPLVTPVAGAASPLPHQAAGTSVAVGKLTPRGCTFAAGTAACDLYAMAGTTSLLGTSVPIWGFSSTGAAGAGFAD